MEMQNVPLIEDNDWEFLDYAFELEKELRRSLPRFTDKELLETFPEVKAIIPQKIVEWEEKQIKLTVILKKKLMLIKHQIVDEFSQWFWREWTKVTDGVELLKIERHIERLRRLWWVFSDRKLKGRITEEQIKQASTTPIENLIGQPLRKSGKTLVGLCPLHNEKHPSFYIYPESNSFYCFGCSQGGDAIALVRLLHGYSFKEAIAYLIGN